MTAPARLRAIDWRDPHLGPGLAQARAIVLNPALCAARPGRCLIAWAALASARGDTGLQRRLAARQAAQGGSA